MVKFSSSRSAKSKGQITNTLNPTKNIKQHKPKIAQQIFLEGRYLFVVAIICLGLFALIGRAAFVQVINVETFNYEADKRSLRQQKVLPSRGTILDRNGQMLAVSVPVYNIKADAKIITEGNYLADKERWQALANALSISYKELVARIEKKSTSRETILGRQITKDVKDYIAQLNIPGIKFENDFRRFYPRAEETAHIIGFTKVVDNSGLEGIERSFNSLLVGTAGSRTYRKDRQGNIIEEISDVQTREAHSLMLSIDEKLQSVAYTEIAKAVANHNANSGTAVLIDIRTGEVLAMANAPSYNPNRRTNVTQDLIRNRALTDVFEPGSTVKPFVVLSALQSGAAQRDEVIDTGPLVLNGYEVKDVAPRAQQTLDQILENSSNRGVSRLALRMPPSVLMETYGNAGLGKSTDLGLGGEQTGSLRSNRKHWSQIDIASASYGYGINATPLQIARAYATLGSFGVYRPLSITKVDPPVIGKRVFPEKLTREVVNMLEKAAIKNKRAMVENYRVAIKTGTAKKLEQGKYVDKYMAYTAGIAPVSNPRFALVILMDEPKSGQYYGGQISAPVFSNIMEYALRAYNITPDAAINQSNSRTVKRVVRLNNQRTEKQTN